MSIHTIFLPDVGEGIAEAELAEWNVKVGDIVSEDDILGVVMTDKVAVEIPSSVSGTINWLAGKVGDFVAVGDEYVKLEISDKGDNGKSQKTNPLSFEKEQKPREKPITSPSVRKRALNKNIDLYQVTGTGPSGRILREDLENYITNLSQETFDIRQKADDIKAIKIVGMRRKIADKMSLANSAIPHITIVEEIEVNALEELRAKLNDKYLKQRAKLTLLPFMMQAIVGAVKEQPQMNAHFDDEKNIIHQYDSVHIGIATQTKKGLLVPVVKHAQNLTLWQSSKQISTLANLARNGKATRDELTGSTITISSLGSMGGLVTTPIINHPEVAIIGINKIAIRPMWDGQQFVPKKMINISCSFDHRVIDGWDAALFVKSIKTQLETPAIMFIED